MRTSFLAAFFTAVLLSGCGTMQSTLNHAGPASEKITHLSWLVYGLFGAILVVMYVLILLMVTRPHGTFAAHAPVNIGGGHSWILIGGFAVPVTILFVIFIAGIDTLSGFPVHDGDHVPAEIRVTGHQWWWQINYLAGGVDQQFTTANEIHIPVGRPVDIDLVSADVIHSFWVPALHGKVDLIPGQVNRIRIEADHPGTFRGQCGVYCGMQHAHMELLVVADATDAYQAWLDNQRSDAVAATDGDSLRGQALFIARPCEFCHTIRGTLAGGKVGPDLTHFASRQGVAANSYPNNDATLTAWVTHAQSMKPGAKMPDITQFDGEQLREIVAYLRQLK